MTLSLIRPRWISSSELNTELWKSGWGYYQDNTYTESSPLVINNARVALSIDGAWSNTETWYLPNTGGLWDITNDEITLDAVGDSFIFRLDWKAKAGSNNSFYDIELDIWDWSTIDIIEDTMQMVKWVNAEQRFSRTYPWFSLTTFISNGWKLYFDTREDVVNLSVYDIWIVIKKLL